MIALGELARHISHALGGNGHRHEEIAWLIKKIKMASR
jgi:hypothetical protein